MIEAETAWEPEKSLRMLWERFATAIKIDRIPLFDVSRHGHGVIGRSMFHASA